MGEDFGVATLAALAKEALEFGRGQYLTTCPGCPQKKHRSLSERRHLSACVSLPFLPSFGGCSELSGRDEGVNEFGDEGGVLKGATEVGVDLNKRS